MIDHTTSRSVETVGVSSSPRKSSPRLYTNGAAGPKASKFSIETQRGREDIWRRVEIQDRPDTTISMDANVTTIDDNTSGNLGHLRAGRIVVFDVGTAFLSCVRGWFLDYESHALTN